jgi:hypothetical protein
LTTLTLAAQTPEPVAQAAQPGHVAGIVTVVTDDGRRLLTNIGAGERPTVPPTTSPAPRGLDPLIEQISRQHGVDPLLTRAVIEVESSFDPNAVSPKGALGLMQLIPDTGRRFGVNNFFDPADNIGGGVRFLRFLIDKFDGNPDLVLAAYNSGENRVARLGRIPAIPETVNYVRRVRETYARLGGTGTLPVAEPEARPAGSGSAATGTVYRIVDERGVSTFSTVGPSH